MKNYNHIGFGKLTKSFKQFAGMEGIYNQYIIWENNTEIQLAIPIKSVHTIETYLLEYYKKGA